MSTIGEPSQPLRVRSVVGLAYDAIRELIVGGTLAPGTRLGQAELADQLGISRGSVREALRRLAGDGLVEFEVNRGFFVADFGLEVVLERLEARLLLEPQVARLAAARRTEDDLAALREAISDGAGGDDVGRGPRRQPCVPPRSRRRNAERAAVAADRRALDRRRRPAAARPPLRDAHVAGRRRQRARGDPGGDRRTATSAAPRHSCAGTTRTRCATGRISSTLAADELRRQSPTRRDRCLTSVSAAPRERSVGQPLATRQPSRWCIQTFGST